MVSQMQPPVSPLGGGVGLDMGGGGTGSRPLFPAPAAPPPCPRSWLQYWYDHSLLDPVRRQVPPHLSARTGCPPSPRAPGGEVSGRGKIQFFYQRKLHKCYAKIFLF